MRIDDYVCSSMQIRNYSWQNSYVYHQCLAVHKLYHWLIMGNPLKEWFFELIEDAIGSKAMKQFIKEEEMNSKSKKHARENK